jgi:HEAT repeat protein
MATDAKELIARLKSADVIVRRNAAEYLSRIATSAAADAEALVAACRDDDEQVREWLFAALEELPAPPDQCAEPLAALLRDESADVAYWAATLLGRMESAGAAGVPNLSAILAAHPQITLRQRAAWALGKIGAAAEGSRSELEKAAASDDAKLAQFARLALRKLNE